ncbi:YcaO-like family protein [Kribbella sp. NPDC059898]|uniref:YcaO-like family protein n=1 Tax=Kribbella sp. NPDC059898 TaxID=3346995 RepID=UPI00364ACCD7
MKPIHNDEAQQTFDRFVHLSAAAGITRIGDVTGLDIVGIPVALGFRPSARSLVIAIGKGITPAAARVGALMESLECWYAEYVEPDLMDTPYTELIGAAVDPETLPLAVDFPRRLDLRVRPASWLRGFGALSGEPVWTPYDVTSLDYRSKSLTPPWLARTSNGLASGATRAAAALHGLCEVIERDAEWRWRHSADSRRIDLGTVNDDDCCVLLEAADRAGIRVAAWDVTSALGVPCVGVVTMAHPDAGVWGGGGVHDGFSCHPSPQRAFAAAVLEALQKRLTYISGSRDDLSRAEMAHAASPDLATAVWAEADAEEPTVAWPSAAPADHPESLFRQLCQTVQELVGQEPVVVSLAEGESVPSVVKVIVPGLHGPFGMSAPPSCLADLHE